MKNSLSCIFRRTAAIAALLAAAIAGDGTTRAQAKDVVAPGAHPAVAGANRATPASPRVATIRNDKFDRVAPIATLTSGTITVHLTPVDFDALAALRASGFTLRAAGAAEDAVPDSSAAGADLAQDVNLIGLNRVLTLRSRDRMQGPARNGIPPASVRRFLGKLWNEHYTDPAAREKRTVDLWKAIPFDHATWVASLPKKGDVREPDTVLVNVMATNITTRHITGLLSEKPGTPVSVNDLVDTSTLTQVLRETIDDMLRWRDARSLALRDPDLQRQLEILEEHETAEGWLRTLSKADAPPRGPRQSGARTETEQGRAAERFAGNTRLRRELLAGIKLTPSGREAYTLYAAYEGGDVPPPSAPAAAIETLVPRKGYPKPKTVLRDDWTKGRKPNFERLRPHEIRQITVHHAGETAKQPYDQSLRNLLNFSLTQKPWGDVPYHFHIAPDGVIYEGRPLDYAGDTNTAYNPGGHALPCLMGNLMEMKFDKPQRTALVEICAWLASTHGIAPATIRGHKDWASTDCPGANVYPLLTSGELQHEIALRLQAQGLLGPETPATAK